MSSPGYGVGVEVAAVDAVGYDVTGKLEYGGGCGGRVSNDSRLKVDISDFAG